MPRTAPTVDRTGMTKRTLTMRYIDVSGDKRADSFVIAQTATDLAIEAFIAAWSALSNANMYEIQITDLFKAQASASLAATGTKSDSVYDNVVFNRNSIAADKSESLFVPAPVASLFELTPGGDPTDTPDLNNPVLTQIDTLLNAIQPFNYDPVSYRYTERSEVNEKVNV